MVDKVDTSDNMTGPFKRVVRRLPVELKKDEELIQTLMAYLQLGGEKLARHASEAARQTHELEMVQRKKRARHDALIRAAEARLAEKGAENTVNDDEFDDDDDDDDDDLKAY